MLFNNPQFVIEDWFITRDSSLIKKIKVATEEEKINIAINLGVDNLFVTKFQRNVVFKNYIYLQILQDKTINNLILKELFELVSKFIGKEDLFYQKSIRKQDRLEAYDSIEKFNSVLKDARKDIPHHLEELYDMAMAKGDFDMLSALIYHYRIHFDKTFVIDKLFSESLLYQGLVDSHRFQFYFEKFAVENIKNYRVFIEEDPRTLRYLHGLSIIISEKLIQKLIKYVFEILSIEKNSKNKKVFGHLLERVYQIVPNLYIKHLNLQKKVKLINKVFRLKSLISLTKHTLVDLNASTFHNILVELCDNFYFEVAETFVEDFETRFYQNLENKYKFMVYLRIALLKYGLNDYKNALAYYSKSLKWIDSSVDLKTEHFYQTHQDYKEQFASKKFMKTLLLIYISTCHCRLNDEESYKTIVGEVKEHIQELNKDVEKCYIYFEFSLHFAEVTDFENERFYLKKTLKYNTEKYIPASVPYLEIRINQFINAEMGAHKLLEIQNENNVQRFLTVGILSARCSFFHESVKFLKKGMDLVQKLSGSNRHKLEYLLKLNLAYSNLYKNDLKCALSFFQKAFLMEKSSIESLAYIILLLFKLNREEELLKYLPTLFSKLENESQLNYKGIFHWIIDLLNILKKDKFIEFVRLIEIQESSKKWRLLYYLGYEALGSGFFTIAEDILSRIIRNSKNRELLRDSYILLGNLHANQDDYETAIIYFQKSLSFEEHGADTHDKLSRCYRNLYDYQNAKKYINAAISITVNQGQKGIDFATLSLHNERIESLFKEVLNLSKIQEEKARIALMTAEKLYFDYQQRENIPSFFDASGIITGYAKGLEIILQERIAKFLIPEVRNYFLKMKLKNQKVSRNFIREFGGLQKGKSISLGTWCNIIKRVTRNPVKKPYRIIRRIINERIDGAGLEQIYNACESVYQLRNKLSHNDVINIKTIQKYRLTIINSFNEALAYL